MTTTSSADALPNAPRLADLTPYFSITVLECVHNDPEPAFETLLRFLRRSAEDKGRAIDVDVGPDIRLGHDDVIEELGSIEEFGFTGLYCVSRTLHRTPSWVDKESGLVDVVNQLTIVLRRNRLVAVHSGITSKEQLHTWAAKDITPYRAIPTDTLADTITGDARMLWTQGTHRRRVTKADTKALGGLRIQDALDPIDDGSFALSAAKINYQPEDTSSVLRNNITFSTKSRISWKATTYFAEFLNAVTEALDLVDKSLAGGDPADPQFPQLAVRETDLSRVRGAFDVQVVDPDHVRAEPESDEDTVDRAESLQDALIDTRGFPNSPVAHVDVGRNGVVAGTLSLKPVPTSGGGFLLQTGYVGQPSADAIAREIKDAIQDGDLLSVYYESGHAFTGHHISRRSLSGSSFPNVRFEDFTGFEVTKEKPKLDEDRLHDAIARNGDDSLFAWVVDRFGDDWLLCDDGAGEIADFLHLDNEGTLTAIHVKAADTNSPHRRIAVARFDVVVSQAEKNVRLLDNDTLIERLIQPRPTPRAVWHGKARSSTGDFVDQLRARTATDRTLVMIVQPHLLETVYHTARAAIDAKRLDQNAQSLVLLDNLLNSTRRTVTGFWEDLIVVGCA